MIFGGLVIGSANGSIAYVILTRLDIVKDIAFDQVYLILVKVQILEIY